MCGRYASNTPPDLMRQIFRTSNVLPNIPARYNIAPTQDVPVIRRNPESGEHSLDLLRWGLIPHWANDTGIGAMLINARAEGLTERPAFREAFRRRRCLVPATAFYEWRRGTKPKQPFAVRRRDGRPLAFAGLWENWKTPEGQWLRSFTIITVPANELLALLHERMPAILEEADYALWLGDQPAEPEQLLALLRPFPAELLETYPVSPAVNSVRTDDSSLLDRAGPSGG